MKVFANRIGFSRAAMIVSAFFVAASCTSTTGTHVQLNQTAVSKIHSVGVVVKKEEEFSVRLSREKMTDAGAAFFGLVGVGIEAGARASTDSRYRERLKPALGDFDPVAALGERARQTLAACERFAQVQCLPADNPTNDRTEAYDGILEITLLQWGMRPCLGPGGAEREEVQAALNLHSRMILTRDKTTIWDRDELYLEGTCHSIEQLSSHGTLLRDALMRAVNAAAGRITNEILFP